jgi:hypothetical protein
MNPDLLNTQPQIGNTAHTTPNAMFNTTQQPPMVSGENQLKTLSPNFDASILSQQGVSAPSTANYGSMYFDAINSYTDPWAAMMKDAEGKTSSALGAYNQTGSDVDELMRRIGGKSTREGQLSEEMGLNQARQNVADLDVEAMQIKNSLNQEKSNTAGFTREQADARDNALNRLASFKLTDLEIRKAAMTNNIAKLETSLDRRLNLEFAPLETELKIREKWFDANKDRLSTAEQRQFTIAQKQVESQISYEKEGREAINDIIKTAVKNGIVIPDNVMARVQSATTAEGKYLELMKAGISLKASSSTGGSFTESQLNAGASKAGMSTEEFATLPVDVKNYYINQPKRVDPETGKSTTFDEQFERLLDGISLGETDPDELVETINGWDLPEDVIAHLIERVENVRGTAGQDAPGFGSRMWSTIKGFFS